MRGRPGQPIRHGTDRPRLRRSGPGRNLHRHSGGLRRRNDHGADRRPTPRRSQLDEVPATIAGSVHAAIVDAACDPTDVVGIGIGCPGQVDRTAGTFGNASTLPDWPDSFPLAAEVSGHLSRPVVLDNDVRLAVAAEISSGSGRAFPSFLGVFLGTGVGAGWCSTVSCGWSRGNAGEFGMVVDFEVDARPCSCGRTGCVQAYAGRAGWRRPPGLQPTRIARLHCSTSWSSATGTG